MAPFWNFVVILIMVLSVTVNAHMRLFYPPPFNAPNNPYRAGPNDTRLEYPYGCCGEEETPICRGYLNQLGTEQGRPVATWETGSIQSFSLIGNSTHWGGSCQVGFSVDGGETWKVVASYVGNCPHRYSEPTDIEGQTFEFTVPADMPLGNHVFAWTWINREQEFNMLCSSVEITGPGDGQGVSVPDADTINTEASEDSISQHIPTGSPRNDDIPTTSPAPSFVPQQTDALNNEPTGVTQLPPLFSPAIIAIPPDFLTSKTSDKCEGPYMFNATVLKPHIGFGFHRRSGKHPCARSNSYPAHGRGRPYVPVEAPRPSTTLDPKSKRTGPAHAIAFFERPSFLFANLKKGSGCSTVKGYFEVEYPNPGPDVVDGDGEVPLASPSPTVGCATLWNITSSDVGLQSAATATGESLS